MAIVLCDITVHVGSLCLIGAIVLNAYIGRISWPILILLFVISTTVFSYYVNKCD